MHHLQTSNELLDINVRDIMSKDRKLTGVQLHNCRCDTGRCQAA